MKGGCHINQKLKIIIRIPFIFIILGLLLFLCAGSLYYYEAWGFCLALITPAVIVISFFLKKDPELLENRILKRSEKEKDQKLIQKTLSIFFIIGLVMPGLDFRFQWSNVPIAIVLVSDLLVIMGYLIIVRVMYENRFATAIIETSQEQKVTETGPYKIVRHPMYTGGVFMFLFTPLALGSYWALIPFFIGTLIGIVLRIKGEEKYLNENLPGYKEYCQKTKYRLVPYIW